MKAIVIFILLLPISLFAQDYDDVAVLMNTNDPESVLIGEYFQAKNNVPDENMFYLEMPTLEIIDSIQYAMIAEELRSLFEANPQRDEINYLVTTKGCPQAVSIVVGCQKRSFEILMSNLTTSDLFLLISMNETPFSFVDAGYRIVSRIEAGTLQGTYGLIDRGGMQNIDLNLDVVLDFYNPFNATDELQIFDYIIEHLDSISLSLRELGFSTELDTLESYYNSDADVLIYSQVAWSHIGVPLSPFVEKVKSMGVLMVSESAFKSNYGDGLSVFDFLEAKCHAAIGYVDGYFLGSIDDQSGFFKNYLNVENGLTIGESAFAAMDIRCPYVLFGDPKSKVAIITSTSNLETPIIKDIYPIPTSDYLNIDFEESKERSIIICDMDGKYLYSHSILRMENRIDVSTLPSGFLLVAIKEGDKVDVRKIIKM